MKKSPPQGKPKGSVLGGFATEYAILRAVRTEEAKAIRRIFGDRGHCRFANRYYLPATDGCANTITGVQKDNLLMVEYDAD